MAGTVVANVLNTDTGLFQTNNAYNGIAKAWVNYNGSAQTITSSFNVSSVTYNSTGYYTINFATAMPNANYSVSAGASATGSTQVACMPCSNNSFVYQAPSTTALPIFTANYSAAKDPTVVCVAVFSS